MGNHSPSRYRREGRAAYYRGGDRIEVCPYHASTWSSKRNHWLEGWEEAAKADVDVPEYGGYIAALRDEYTDEQIDAMSNIELVIALDAINERNLKGF